jgi:hypothetical protein
MRRQSNNLDFLYLGYEPEDREFESLRAHLWYPDKIENVLSVPAKAYGTGTV